MGYSKVSRVKELPDSLVKSIEDKTYYINPVSGIQEHLPHHFKPQNL